MNNETYLELTAQLQSQRFLTEVLYANLFAGQEQEFIAVIREMQRLTSAAPVTSEPLSTDVQREELVELQIRTSTHLGLFQQGVLRRMKTRIL